LFQDKSVPTESTHEYICSILSCTDISKFKIDYIKYHHIFFIDKVNFNKISIQNKFDIDSFNQFNIKINIINKLNISYNKIQNYNNYTKYRLQDLFIEYINKDQDKLEYICDHIYNNFLENAYISIGMYDVIDNIMILSNFLSIQPIQYDNYKTRHLNTQTFIDVYSKRILYHFNIQYYKSNVGLSKICNDFTKILSRNKFFIDIIYNTEFEHYVNCNMLNIFESYLNDVLINDSFVDNNIITTLYNNNNEFANIILNFSERWILKFNQNESPNVELVISLLNILPIIEINNNNNRSLYSTIFNTKIGLFDYLIHNLDMNTISLLSLYENTKKLWSDYLKSLYNRVLNIIQMGKFEYSILYTEIDMFNKLINKKNNYHKSSKIVKLFLDDLRNFIVNNTNIQKAFSKDDDNDDATDKNIKDCDIDISNITYTIINKQIYNKLDKQYIQLCDDNLYTSELKQYIKIGKTYYDKLYYTDIIEWRIEQSIINITINNMDITCNIVQYLLISSISQKEYNIDTLISTIINKKSNKEHTIIYLQSYISNLLLNNIIKLINNILIISTDDSLITHDISTFIPTLDVSQIVFNNIDLDTDSANYLRYLILTKMFKNNSTQKFKIDYLKQSILNFIDKIKFNTNLKYIFNIEIKELIECLKFLEKRDIIEQISPNEYIYVV